jgi:Spx/MgsR family transcriptional regulator
VRHDLARETPSRELLGRLIDEHGLDAVLNTRSPAYKALGGRKLGKSEALELMMKDANLIKRPLVLGKNNAVLGYKPEEYDKLR